MNYPHKIRKSLILEAQTAEAEAAIKRFARGVGDAFDKVKAGDPILQSAAVRTQALAAGHAGMEASRDDVGPPEPAGPPASLEALEQQEAQREAAVTAQWQARPELKAALERAELLVPIARASG